ncbi:hypothetical protein [uncultured Selenomonas sp.]|uniref:hypothetical protein n=1 Tax=uncultured Selenomonas sp. TaxID=159275 RepID=UPI0028EFA8B4|nr:hypothetical protein [uncultured Selenomonas sp.]
MKRIIMLLVGISMLVLPAAVSANYPMYLNGDRNFILCDGHMGTAWYVDASSLNVLRYEPPEYVIAVNVVTARSAIGNEDDFYSGGSGSVTDVRTMRFLYDTGMRARCMRGAMRRWTGTICRRAARGRRRESRCRRARSRSTSPIV